MNILLIDADSKIPNLALMKLSSYHKAKGDNVTLIKFNIPYYPQRKKQIQTIPFGYDKVYCSIIFPTSYPFINDQGLDNIHYGGTGHPHDKPLPHYIEDLEPDYSIYPENNASYGFITRGCIRNCSFCIVRQKEGNIRQVNTVDNIVKHKFVIFLDNNILAHPEHRLFLQQIIEKKIKCEFNQGLDIRLLDENNSLLLSKLKYNKEYVFAFDNWKYKNILDQKIPILDKWRKSWKIKFFLYVHPDMPLQDTLKRIDYLKKRKILPYIMRDISCYEAKYKNFYTDLAAWCNQPAMFKKKTFEEFMIIRNLPKRAAESTELYKKVEREIL